MTKSFCCLKVGRTFSTGALLFQLYLKTKQGHFDERQEYLRYKISQPGLEESEGPQHPNILEDYYCCIFFLEPRNVITGLPLAALNTWVVLQLDVAGKMVVYIFVWKSDVIGNWENSILCGALNVRQSCIVRILENVCNDSKYCMTTCPHHMSNFLTQFIKLYIVSIVCNILLKKKSQNPASPWGVKSILYQITQQPSVASRPTNPLCNG